MKLVFDMDGTLAATYSTDNWLEKLRNYSASPYRTAPPLVDMKRLVRVLSELERYGYEPIICSWLSKESNPIYDEMVRHEKRRWIYKHCGAVPWKEIHITSYGRGKHFTVSAKDNILFDDNEKVRQLWEKHGGIAYDPAQWDIIGILELLLDGEKN